MTTPSYELGFVLAGAVSAGAYSAGALDFLTEALDRWHAARLRARDGNGPPVPEHEVRIKAITGASAGAIVGAIAARAWGVRFPPVTLRANSTDARPNLERDQDNPAWANPFYRSWVLDLDITDLLQTNDLADGRPPTALLDATQLDELAGKVLGQGHSADTHLPRPWLADEVYVALTTTDLDGTGHALRFKGAHQRRSWHHMRRHADFVSARLRPHETPIASGPVQPDLELDYDPGLSEAWRRLAQAALASGAFPLGLPMRSLQLRPDRHRLSRLPHWLPPSQVVDAGSATPRCVDGGVMNNEPIDLARSILFGDAWPNDADLIVDGHWQPAAHRGVILIDPFADETEAWSAAADPSFAQIAGRLLSAWRQQSRLKPIEMNHPEPQRMPLWFQIDPSRGDKTLKRADGSSLPAITGGLLGAFGGLFSRSFRRHDYLLGRRNAQRFLQLAFRLPADHALFEHWPSALKTDPRYRIRGNNGEPDTLPIIPLMDELHSEFGATPAEKAAREEPVPDWPGGAIDRAAIARGLEQRLPPLIEAGKSSLQQAVGRWKLAALLLLPTVLTRRAVRKAVMAMIEKALKGHHLDR